MVAKSTHLCDSLEGVLCQKQTMCIIYFIADCSSKSFVYLITRKQCLKCALSITY